MKLTLLRSSRSIAAGLALIVAATAPAASADSPEDVITRKLSGMVPGLTVTSVNKTEVPGLYEVKTNNREMLYATEDGEYILAGELLQLTDDGVVNVTEQTRSGERAETLAAFNDEGVISYPAKGDEEAVVAVFTDIDCPYCRKMHDEMARMNELGITVNYYGFPRSGPGTASFTKYESVWCADDQRQAMDKAKGGEQVEEKTCENPVEAQYDLGRKLGVTGTPAIVLEDGKMVRGYVPADQLAEGLGLL